MKSFIQYSLRIAFIFLLSNSMLYAQTASLLPNALQQYFDNNGNPLSSGTVTFYTPGTTTKKNIWKDSAEAVLWANPITLDAGGKPPGGGNGIYGEGTYRQIVKDRNGNIIWDAVTAPGGSGGSSPTLVGDGQAVGSIKPWAGIIAPNQYAFAYGQELSRTTYSALFSTITISQVAGCTASSNTLTGIADATQIPVGAPVEILCVAPGTTVVSTTASTIVMSNPATISINAVSVVFPFGNGDGSTTFNVPDLRDYVIAGRGNMGGISASRLTGLSFTPNTPNSQGGVGGVETKVLVTANLPPYTPTLNDPGHFHTATQQVLVSGTAVASGTGATGANALVTPGTQLVNSATTGITASAQGGTSTAFTIVQPTMVMNYVIKINPDISISTSNVVTSLGTMTGAIICGTGLDCSSQTISISGSPGGITDVPHGGTGTGLGFVPNLPLIGNNTSQIIQGSITGNTTVFATSTGSLTDGDCVKIDASGNLVDSGASCGASSNAPVYQIFSSPGAVTTLTLTSTPLPTDGGLLSIAFDGVIQARNTWSLNTGTGVITFTSAIPSGTQIVEADWFSPSTTAGVGNIVVGSNTLSGSVSLIAGTGINLGVSSNNITISQLPSGQIYYAEQLGNLGLGLTSFACNGITDDTPAWNAFMNAVDAQTIAAGSKLIFPYTISYCKFNSQPRQMASYISLLGSSQQNTTFLRNYQPGQAISITNVTDNGGGKCRITYTPVGNITGVSTIYIFGILGATEANGGWSFTQITTNVIDLPACSFTSGYSSGGTILTAAAEPFIELGPQSASDCVGIAPPSGNRCGTSQEFNNFTILSASGTWGGIGLDLGSYNFGGGYGYTYNAKIDHVFVSISGTSGWYSAHRNDGCQSPGHLGTFVGNRDDVVTNSAFYGGDSAFATVQISCTVAARYPNINILEAGVAPYQADLYVLGILDNPNYDLLLSASTINNAIFGSYATISNITVATLNKISFDPSTSLDNYITAGLCSSTINMTGTNNVVYCSSKLNSSSTYVMQTGGSGGVQLTSGATSWAAVSDERLKENIIPLSVLDRLKDNVAYSYDWRENQHHEIGTVAQTIQQMFPDVVTHVKGPNGQDNLGVYKDQIGILALQGVKELLDRVKKLEQQKN